MGRKERHCSFSPIAFKALLTRIVSTWAWWEGKVIGKNKIVPFNGKGKGVVFIALEALLTQLCPHGPIGKYFKTNTN